MSGDAADCCHPLDQLRLDPGSSGQRGGSTTYMVVCDQCEKAWLNAVGFKVFIEAFVKDLDACWAAVRGLGGERPPPTPVLQAADQTQARKECPHFLAWVKLEAKHGHALTIYCTGCTRSWSMAMGLEFMLTRLKAEQAALRGEIARLEGGVS